VLQRVSNLEQKHIEKIIKNPKTTAVLTVDICGNLDNVLDDVLDMPTVENNIGPDHLSVDLLLPASGESPLPRKAPGKAVKRSFSSKHSSQDMESKHC
jgi:hypothetical protein